MPNEMSVQFARLPDISEVGPLTAEDMDCMQEIADVLRRRDRLSRFGVTLLHKHFPVMDDEMLVESCDAKARTLTIRPVKKDEISELEYTATSWDLATGEASVACVCIKMGAEHSHQSRG